MIADELRQRILTWMATARSNGVPVLSPQGDALMIDGGPGYAFYLRPDGTILEELDEWGDEIREVRDPLTRAIALRAGTRHRPELADLLPRRPETAPVCVQCRGSGWDPPGTIVCLTCSGRGWTGAA